MRAHDSYGRFADAVKLADQLPHLRHRRTVRMLALVSDGWYGSHTDAAQHLITTPARSVCAVLWLHPHDEKYCHTYTDTTTVPDPAGAITVIADAAVTAVARA